MTGRKQAVYSVSPFMVDITPPEGHPIAYGINRTADSPLYARGIILEDGSSRAVLAAADFIGLPNRAYAEWRRALSRAAGAPERNVILHSVHQHDSVYPSLAVDEILSSYGFERKLDPDYWNKITRALRDEVSSCAKPGKFRRVYSLAVSETRLAGLASNRRIPGKDGKIEAMRFSMCGDPALRAKPVGLIDPILRTAAFIGRGGGIISSVHFYATHPQVAYLRNMAGSDVPGRALRAVEKKHKGLHIYFSGCGGNITLGKYTSGSPGENLDNLGDRLGEGMLAGLSTLREKPLGRLRVMRAGLNLPLSEKFTEEHFISELDKKPDVYDKARALASRLYLLRNIGKSLKPELKRVSFGPDAHILSFPSEVVVEYQLYAQELAPEHFMACASNADFSYGYFPTAKMFDEGGYEPTAGIYTPEVEGELKRGIRKILEDI